MPLTQEELQAIVKQTTDAAVKAAADAVTTQMKGVTDSQAEFAKNLKILSDTMAADKKSDEDAAAKAAAAAAAGDGKGDKKPAAGEQPKYLTAEDLLKVLDDRDKKSQASAATVAARQKVIDAKGLAKVPAEFLANAPDSADEKELTAWADKVVARVNEILPGKIAANVGGAAGDGGTAAGKGGGEQKPAVKLNGLSPAIQKYADSIKLPDAPATAAAK